MSFVSRQNKVVRHAVFCAMTILLLAFLFDFSSAFARGRKGGGAAGALDDFDLFLMMQTTNGLPVNLINGFEPANSIAGDGTIGVGGTIMFDPNQPTINSQSGEAITLLPSSVNGDSGHRAGMARKLGPDGLPAMLSLKSVPIPSVPELTRFIRDRKAAVALGKALFWDMQAGSDGNACASCHFHAGADNRMKNQISSGLKANDQVFQRALNGAGGPNYKLNKDDFPFHRLADPLDRNSNVLFDSNDVVSSQGAFGGAFQKIGPNGKELCGDRPNPDNSNINGVMTRRVAPRNTPSTINAVFNFRNFWDGRANNVFNGVSPFGPRDTNAKVLERLPDGTSVWTTIALRNASLASQAVGPALSDFEMSCANRTFKDLGRKMLSLQPLRLQRIHPHDSVLGSYIAKNQRGLNQSYPELIRAAFDPRWWSSPDDFDGYSQMESNFSLYWGLAIMMYESTLVSDETPFDKLIGDAGHPPDLKALTTQQLRGLGLFRGKGQCLSCHKGAEFTGAGSALQPDSAEGTVIESMLLKTGGLAVYDNGFYNIGVRPTSEDLGVGDTDPFGNALSLVRNWFDQLRLRTVAEPVLVDPCRFSIFFDASACWIAPDANRTRIVADGAFKTPSLRNVALTQPYFHNGSRLTLEQVVEFYNRGGDRRGPDNNDTTGFVTTGAANGGPTNLHPSIKPLGLTPSEIDDLVSFMRHALTDPRVACERAPFDHPSLRLNNGHVGDENGVRDSDHDGRADDQFEFLPAIGRNGRSLEDCLLNDDGSSFGSQSVQTPPVVTEPVVTPPVVTEPVVTPPVVTEPVVTPPVVTEPVVTPPVVTEPVVTPPVVTEPVVTPPVVTEPVVTPPVVAEPVINNITSNPAVLNMGGGVNLAGFDRINANDDIRDRTNSVRNKDNENRSEDSVQTKKTESNNEPLGERKTEQESHHEVKPAVSVNAPDKVLVRSRVTMHGSVSTGTTFVWTQIEGPEVILSAPNTLAPNFTAPARPERLVFELTATNTSGDSATTYCIINVVADDVSVSQVTWSKLQTKDKRKNTNVGELSIVATSSAITDNKQPPIGMAMNVEFWSEAIPEGLLGSATNPVEVPMTLVRDMPNRPPTCASKLPCFSVAHVEGIVDPRSSSTDPLFIPPTTVVVKSLFGGISVVRGEEIQLR